MPGPPAELSREPSFDAVQLHLDGTDFDATFGSQRTIPLGDSALYNPNYEIAAGSQSFDLIAYGVYSIVVSDYDGDPRIDFDWDSAPAEGTYWIGLSDVAERHWQWFDGAASLDLGDAGSQAFAPYTYANGEMLVALVLLGQSGHTLNGIDIGPPLPDPELPLELITLPAGFSIYEYAYPVPNARALALGDQGTVFVGSRSEGKVYALRDINNDMFADEVLTIAEDYNMPVGIDFREGDLYFSDVDEIWRLDDIENNLDTPPAAELVSDDFPTDESHGWRFIKFGPDGKLYVPIGAPCNICDQGDPYASIWRMDSDGTNLEIYARGVRNTVGFDWHPDTDELWFTDNGGDNLGDGIPPDELNRRATDFAGVPHYGYPFIWGDDGVYPGFGEGEDPEDYVAPVQNLTAHTASLGMRFYTGEMFPEEYRGQVFIAEHGDWNNFTDQVGALVSLVRIDGNGDALSYETFADGWTFENGDRWGRPVDVLVMPDGSLLVSDDHAGAVYRIVYED
jgi:glucose/arabinose dehydrogenase